jgi:hypothetical protein
VWEFGGKSERVERLWKGSSIRERKGSKFVMMG